VREGGIFDKGEEVAAPGLSPRFSTDAFKQEESNKPCDVNKESYYQG